MKTSIRKTLAGTVIAFATVSLGPVTLEAAAGSSSTGSKTNQSAHASDSKKSKKDGNLRLTRADDVLGHDVRSTDGKKVGDVVDFVFHLNNDSPRISHVLIMSGGFLDMGGDVRAVPAEMITMKDDALHIDTDAQEFYRGPLVGRDRVAFFSDQARVRSLNEHFGQSETKRAGESSKQGESILFTSLNANEVEGSDGSELGRVTDAWINLEESRVPLIEIDPSVEVGSAFEAQPIGLRYQIPAAKYTQAEDDQHAFEVSVADLENAPTVQSVDYVTAEEAARGMVLQLDLSKARNQSSGS